MGQELLARGMKAQGTLWSATALLEEKYHKLLYAMRQEPRVAKIFQNFYLRIRPNVL